MGHCSLCATLTALDALLQAAMIASLNGAGFTDKFAADKREKGDARALGATMGM